MSDSGSLEINQKVDLTNKPVTTSFSTETKASPCDKAMDYTP